jgi:hypothetical protein
VKTLGFTGTRNCTPEQVINLTAPWAHADWKKFDRFVTGACRGFDAIIGVALVARFPDKQHLVIVPANWSQVVEWWDDPEMEAFLDEHGGELKVLYMDTPTNYRDRNQVIVNHSDELFYLAEFPEGSTSSIRSGTWQTVRMARKKPIRVDGVIINA